MTVRRIGSSLKPEGGGRSNQRLRTRKDLLAAAAALLKQGRTPGMDEIAERAMVSRATAYRYFPSLDALLIEAPLEGEVPDPAALFEGVGAQDIEARVETALLALHEMTWRNAAQLKRMLASSLANAEGSAPKRQNRRLPLIEAALAPIRAELPRPAFTRLARGLSLLFGTEAMVVCSDVLEIGERAAKETLIWAARSMVRQALQEAGRGAG